MVKSLDVARGDQQGIYSQNRMSAMRELRLEEQDSEKSKALCAIWRNLGFTGDLQVRARALVSMCLKANTIEADEAFYELEVGRDMDNIPNPVTCRIGMYY